MEHCEHEVEFAQKLAEVDARSRSNVRQLDKMEKMQESLHDMASSVKILAEEQKHTREAVEKVSEGQTKMENRIDAIEQKPGKRWEQIVDKAIWLIVGAAIAALLAQAGIVV